MSIKKSILVIAFGLFFQCASVHAEIGEIAINGEVIPKVLFKGYEIHQMLRADVCPPTSDAYIRDHVIRRALVVIAGQKKGLAIPESDQTRINKFEQELEYLGPDGDPDEIARAEHLKYSSLYGGYIPGFPARASHQEVLDEYKRLIKEKDPRFTNVYIVKHSLLEFASEADANSATELLEQGSSVDEIMEQFDDGYFETHHSENWFLVDRDDGFQSDGSDLVVGSVVPVSANKIIYVHDVKNRSRLRPFTKYRNRDDFVYDAIEHDLLRVNQKVRDRNLWQAADVQEDGKPIDLSESYPSCS